MSMAYLEPFSGISGDMTVGAFLDLGMPLDALRDGLAGLPLTGYEISAERVMRGVFRGTRFTVAIEEEHPHRGLAEVRDVLGGGDLPGRVRDRALNAFDRLAAAEGAVHGRDKEEIHFHEVGAVDAIVDIVGAALCLEHFDLDRLVCSRVRVGTGEVECHHGRIPVPAPGALELLEGFPILLAEGEGETTTPTGAAILAAWCEPAAEGLPFCPKATGYGAGRREDTTLPNFLRVTLCDQTGAPRSDEVVEIFANIDDQQPEMLAFAVIRLMESGALDAWSAPIIMKKGRPAVQLTVLARAEDVPKLERVLFAETTTFGVRKAVRSRTTLARHYVQAETPYGRVRVKVGTYFGEEMSCSPEYEDCARLALEKGVPAKLVYEAALRAIPRER